MRTQGTLDLLVNALAANCGDVFDACRQAGVSPMFVTQWRKDDAAVDEKLTEAERVGHLGLYSAAVKRAAYGVEEDVYYKGEVVGSKTVFSDGLMGKFMEAKLPGFQKGENALSGATFNGPTQINMMPRAADYAEWLRMKTQTDAATAPALPAPSNDVLDLQPVQERNPLAGLGV